MPHVTPGLGDGWESNDRQIPGAHGLATLAESWSSREIPPLINRVENAL